MDINLPGASGVEATRRASQIAPGTAVLVVTMVDDDDTVFTALAVGARGYVLKGTAADEITAGVATRLLAHTPGRLPGPASPSRPDDLTSENARYSTCWPKVPATSRSPAPSESP